MVATYIFIISLSTMLATLAGLRLWQRLSPMLGNRFGQTGLCAIVPAIAFLIVVAAPASVLFFALASIALMLIAPKFMHPFAEKLIWVIIAIGAILFFIHTPDKTPFPALPLKAVMGISFASWLAMMLSAPYAPPNPSTFALWVIAACLPLAATPLLAPHAGSVAIDAAILATAWFSILPLAREHYLTGIGTQIATALILGYLQVAAFWSGAWPTALASIIIWFAGIAHACLREKTYHDRRPEWSSHA